MDATVSTDAQKRQRVLEGALTQFLSYGYKRTTMDDIAKASDMSRPALYLHFQNKADIYRAIGYQMFEASGREMAQILNGEGTLGERLGRAFQGTIIVKMSEIMQSPHGAELMDLKNELAVGMIEEWRDHTAALVRDAIERDTAARGVDLAERGLTAEGVAELALDMLEGLKQRTKDRETLLRGAQQLVTLVDLAVR